MVETKRITEEEISGFTITTGASLGIDYITAVLSKDRRLEKNPEDNHSYFFIRFEADWWFFESAYPIVSQATVLGGTDSIISISDVGIVRRSAPSGGDEEANVGDFSEQRVLGRTRLTEVRAIENTAYAVGTRRAVYRREKPDAWTCIDEGCYAKSNFEVGFESIHGFSESEIYACGDKGEIWQFDGRNWEQLDTGTNVSLNKLVCAENGFVYVVGDNGTILKGRSDQWSIIEGISSSHEFWSVESYNNRIFITADTMLLYELLPDEELKLVDFGDCATPATAYHLTKDDNSLYCFGFKDIRRFDGNEWEEILSLE